MGLALEDEHQKPQRGRFPGTTTNSFALLPHDRPYASRDADVLEYHMLLMKFSGVDGLMIDWYGVQGTNGDLNDLLTSSNAIVNQTQNYGLDYSVVMEDRFSANIGQAKPMLPTCVTTTSTIRITSALTPIMIRF